MLECWVYVITHTRYEITVLHKLMASGSLWSDNISWSTVDGSESSDEVTGECRWTYDGLLKATGCSEIGTTIVRSPADLRLTFPGRIII